MEQLKDPPKGFVGWLGGLAPTFQEGWWGISFFFKLLKKPKKLTNFFPFFFSAIFFLEGDIDNMGVGKSPITHNKPLSILFY